MRDTDSLVEVWPLAGVGRMKDPLVYRLPSSTGEGVAVTPGSLVRIPLRNRHELGVVWRLGTDQVLPAAKIRYIHGGFLPHPVLTPELLELASWMRGYYGSSLPSVLEAMIPSPVRKGLNPKVRKFLEVSRPGPGTAEREALERRAPRQAALLQFLEGQSRPVPKSVVLARLGMSAQSCRSLLEKGWIRETAERQERVAYEDDLGEGELGAAGRHVLNLEQETVVGHHRECLDRRGFEVRLLHGITGSGKTEVYLRSIEKVVAEGGGVLFLVPEVALAPQTVGRLRGRLGELGVRTIVWHSLLGDGERYDAWNAIASGEARVVVGARSAVFAPVQCLRLVIVDEEHEPAYKQDENPRYHGRDVAVYRSKLCRALCILGSATPSLESLYNSRLGKYAQDRLTRRIDDRKLPMVHLVDMRLEHIRNQEKRKGPMALSRVLVEKLIDRFERKEQTILFLNRRGFATSLLCMRCGWVAESPNSSVSMTYHRADDTLKCHLSGYTEEAPDRCPKCGSPDLRKRGLGTQRVETVVQALLPRARVVRMDADAMARKNLHRLILSDFRLGKIDILIGTQMIAKGLDFPNVTLVGLVDADLSLHHPDFRSGERTFQLVVQVSGRAGRGDGHGEVVIQTFNPQSDPLQFARRQDFDGYLEEELNQRREYNYPPYRHLIRQVFRGMNGEKVAFYAEQFARRAEEVLGHRAEIRGPTPAPLEKIKDYYRYHIWYFVQGVAPTVARLLSLRDSFPMDRDVEDVLDVDPVHLL